MPLHSQSRNKSGMTEMHASIDPAQAALFGSLAENWWNPKGESALLHRINPVRLRYIRAAIDSHFATDPKARQPLAGKRAIDVGCGAGLLAEPLARLGAEMHGLDASPDNIAVAQRHAEGQGLQIDYQSGEVAALAASGARFDLVTCMEVFEHVVGLDKFIADLARILAPGGLLIFSTPNRTPMSRAVLITGAEDIFRIIPKGAHDWEKFVTPDEVGAMLAAQGLVMRDVQGLSYSATQGFVLCADIRVNYIASASRA